MSIEVDLGRIATALEALVKLQTGGHPVATTAVPATPAKDKKTAVKVPAVVPVVAEPDVDPFAQEEPAGEAEITFDALSTLLRTHSVKFGPKTTIALIKKHGADQAAPKLNTIPTVNYKACFDEATADLKKVKA